MKPDPNTLLRTQPCAKCGAQMLWTQNAWGQGEHRSAAYQCANGHVDDPTTTRECPVCGVHDTRTLESTAEQETHACNACGERFVTKL
jgi:predicted RNA-binding Zn-ribbon protein involved in translation (DUF1610 family)